MLIISRKARESITIRVGNDTLKLLVLTNANGRCRIGFEGPAQFRILREELEAERKSAPKAVVENNAV